ncbi:MAG: prepilin-type N-terminal cleavage/methylation domain-containing protein [Gammaproteobacteria bacterium]
MLLDVAEKKYQQTGGFSLIELLIVVAIAALLISIAIPTYRDYIRRANAAQAAADLLAIELAIEKYRVTNRNQLPPRLEDIGSGDLRDPWGRRYVYLELDRRNARRGRKNRNLAPLNTDYDLYSSGEDGLSSLPIDAIVSQDDVIRANNGSYFGLAEEY